MPDSPAPSYSIDPSTVRAAVFDLGGVILAGGPSDVRAFGARVGLDDERWGTLRTEIFGHGGPWAEIERGEIEFDEFCRHLCERIVASGGTADVELTSQFMGNRSEQSQRERVRHEMLDAIRRVRARMPTALLTNNIAEWRATWSRILPVGDLFDVVVDSSEVGMRKPEPRIYEHTQQALGIDHDGIFFVDDLGTNLKAARALGWQTLLYADTEEVLTVLGRIAEGR